jgi:hypothetical protein
MFLGYGSPGNPGNPGDYGGRVLMSPGNPGDYGSRVLMPPGERGDYGARVLMWPHPSLLSGMMSPGEIQQLWKEVAAQSGLEDGVKVSMNGGVNGSGMLGSPSLATMSAMSAMSGLQSPLLQGSGFGGLVANGGVPDGFMLPGKVFSRGGREGGSRNVFFWGGEDLWELTPFISVPIRSKQLVIIT